MSSTLAYTALMALALTACTAQTPQEASAVDSAPRSDTPAVAPPPLAPPPGEAAYTDAGGGLSVRLDVPPGPHALGSTVEVGLEFRNTGPDELRIYLVDAPIFRALQSDLAIFTADGAFIASQPEPHPHGYVVGEQDFPAIPAGATRRFTQPLLLDPKQLAATAGDLQLRWTYRNKIESWPGGVQTLDGATRPLFGGGRIPGIWLGEVKASATLPVAR